MQHRLHLAVLLASVPATLCTLEAELPSSDTNAHCIDSDEQLLVQTKVRMKTKEGSALVQTQPVTLSTRQVTDSPMSWSDAKEAADTANAILPTCAELQNNNIGSQATLLLPARGTDPGAETWCSCSSQGCTHEDGLWTNVNIASKVGTDFHLVECPSGCARCSDADTCTGCVAPLLLFNNECVTSCPDTAYPENGVCIDCSTMQVSGGTCNKCSDATTCTECEHWGRLYQGDCYNPCPAHTSASPIPLNQDGIGNICLDCEDSNCNSCIPFNECWECRNDRFMYWAPGTGGSSGTGGACREQCPPRYYGVGLGSSTGRTCNQCSWGCLECTSSNGGCTRCETGKCLTSSGYCANQNQCPSGTIPVTQNNRCECQVPQCLWWCPGHQGYLAAKNDPQCSGCTDVQCAYAYDVNTRCMGQLSFVFHERDYGTGETIHPVGTPEACVKFITEDPRAANCRERRNGQAYKWIQFANAGPGRGVCSCNVPDGQKLSGWDSQNNRWHYDGMTCIELVSTWPESCPL